MLNNGGQNGVVARPEHGASPADADAEAGWLRLSRAWRLFDSVLMGVAAALTGAALAGGLSGLVPLSTGGLAAFVAAGLVGISVGLDAPERARRATAAANHVRLSAATTARSGMVPVPPIVQPVPETPVVSAGLRHRSRLRWAFVLALAFLGIESSAAVVSGSLTLLSDVGHVIADVVGLGMALAAIHLVGTGFRKPSRTFGLYRVEIVAALANAVLLMAMAGYVIFEAVLRLRDPRPVTGGVMVVVALAGLTANLVSAWLLRPGAAESLNVRGAYLDVVADAIGSVGLLVAGGAIHLTGWAWIDPALGAALGLWILPRAVLLGRDALRILVQAAPPHVDVATLEADLGAVPGVVDVHQLHIWTLTSDVEVASAHLRVGGGVDVHRVLDEARTILRDRYRVADVTLQIEPEHYGPDMWSFSTPSDVRALLAAHGVRPSRALGQNFLVDPNTARRIVRLAAIGPDDRVLEIGPGVGSLTLALADVAGGVKALELDRHLLPVLAEVLDGRPTVEVVEGDALTVEYGDLIPDGTWVLVANLPYNVATPLIARLLTEAPQVARMVVMVQREVAARLAAPPGSPPCGSISVKVSYHCTTRVLAQVPPTVFTPRPKVDSTVVAFERRPAPPVDPGPRGPGWMFTLARTGFNQRRKTLRQALKPVLGEGAHAALTAADLDPAARAETLSLDDWAALARMAAPCD